jgi:hypothetical protein
LIRWPTRSGHTLANASRVATCLGCGCTVCSPCRCPGRLCGWQNQLPWVPGWRRRRPDFFHYYGGANHVALNRAAARLVARDPAARRIRRWLRGAAHSDEIVFQSILLNSPLAPTLVNASLREIDFPAGSPHPRVFTRADLPRLLASAALFARKFDEAVDPGVCLTLAARLQVTSPPTP